MPLGRVGFTHLHVLDQPEPFDCDEQLVGRSGYRGVLGDREIRVRLSDSQARFRRLFEAHYGELLGYASRRLPDVTEAHDVVADAFLVLWRRIDEAPGDDEILPWLYGVARRVLSNRLRGQTRRDRLAQRIAQSPRAGLGVDEIARLRADAREVLSSLLELSELDREILLLAGWECLSTREIASVLKCSENAAAIRLHRARRRFADAYAKCAGGAEHIERQPEIRDISEEHG